MSLAAELIENLGMSMSDVHKITESAPARYFVFPIPKRSGGDRIIAQPARELKAIQRYILAEKLSRFRVHKCATAYMAGHSIAKNALAHVHSGPVLKLDFKDFFPSIKSADWLKFSRKHPIEEIDVSDIKMYSKLLFWSGEKNNRTPRCLSIGAPTSPALSNILLYDLDEKFSDYADKIGVKYTRYADDITVSATDPGPIFDFERYARKFVSKQKSPKLEFNDEKRGFFTTGGRRSVTGLIITPDEKISIGRDRKRLISAMLDHSRKNLISDENRAILKGLLGFAISVEVLFVERMREKYGNAVVDKALKYRIPKKTERALTDDF